MKKLLNVSVFLGLAVLMACEGSRVEGTYYNIANPREYIELKNGSKFFLKAGTMDLAGNYSVDGKIIILNPGSRMAAKGKIEKGVITDSEGVKWQKK